METYRVQVRLPLAIMAAVQVDQDRTGETMASIIRRCVRRELAYTYTDPAYRAVLAALAGDLGQAEK